MIEVAGIQNQVKVVVANNSISENQVKEMLKKYFELMEQIEQLKKEADTIKQTLKENGIGIDEPVKVEIPDIGIVKVSLKKSLRETIDKNKMKELVPESLLNQFISKKEVQSYEIRKVKK